ncbi:coiled-coil domain-containing protein 137 isoform X1 [Phyllostomus hastatus]|uniref:coiled-coil domain-containing protein 137 isoform X1 n=1 Tax=Phyllostomus hastatus TaxID=9423 RepID=UPI001E68575F|nr:coiled-coil domain-containing protein 137 isoform X1 [Phyllostomus hastatus]
MARAGRRAAVPAGTAGPGGPGRPQGRRQQPPQGKQRSAPWPRPRSQEKKKVNCKPKNQDEQEIPFRLREIMKSRQEMKNPVSNKKRKKEGGLQKDAGEGGAGRGPGDRGPQVPAEEGGVRRRLRPAHGAGGPARALPQQEPGGPAARGAGSSQGEVGAEESVPEAAAGQSPAEKRGKGGGEAGAGAAPRHGEVRRGRPAAPRADRQAQDEREHGPARQEVTDPGGAPEPRRCAPAPGLLHGQAADRGGGESSGRAGLQGDEDAAAAAAAGGPVSPLPTQEAARDWPVMVGDPGCRAGSAERAGGPEIRALSLDTAWDPEPSAPAPTFRKGLQCPLSFLPPWTLLC